MLCEDRHDLRTLVRIVFEGEGLQVVGEAEDGTSAPDMVARADPVVILRARFPDLRIVVYSGSVEEGIGQRVVELGADRFVSKDVSVERLAGVVREVGAAG